MSEVDIEEMFTYADQVSKYDIGVIINVVISVIIPLYVHVIIYVTICVIICVFHIQSDHDPPQDQDGQISYDEFQTMINPPKVSKKGQILFIFSPASENLNHIHHISRLSHQNPPWRTWPQ